MQDFRQLKAWQKAHQLTLKVYEMTRGFPKEEVYALTCQMRRACVSIPANIAEGCGRAGGRDFARFLQIAIASASETEYYLHLSRDLRYVTRECGTALIALVTEVRRMLSSLLRLITEN